MSMEASRDLSLVDGPINDPAGTFRDAENHLCTTMTQAEAILHINPAILEGVHHPSKRAALVFADALHAAEEYYRLFFTSVNELEENLHKRLASHQRSEPVSSKGALDRGLKWVNELPGSASSSASDDDTGASAHRDEDGRHARRRRQLHVGTRLVHVHNTPYHTFFPPPISGRHARAIIRSLLKGRVPQRFTQWTWTPTVSQRPSPPSSAPPVAASTSAGAITAPAEPGRPAHAESAASQTTPAAAVVSKNTAVAEAVATVTKAAAAAAAAAEESAQSDRTWHTHHSPSVKHHHAHSSSRQEDAWGSADVTSLGTASDSATEMEHNAGDDSPHGDRVPHTSAAHASASAGERDGRGTNVVSTSAPASAHHDAWPHHTALAAERPSAALGRAQSELSLTSASRTHTSTRSRVKSRYDRYDALAQAQATRPHTAAAIAVVGPGGTVGLTHLPSLFNVSPTTASATGEETHTFRALSRPPSMQVVTPVSTVPSATPPPPTLVDSSSQSAALTSPTASPLTEAPTHFDVAAIYTIADPIERARRMSELYDVVLETCKASLVPTEAPLSPMSCTSQSGGGSRRGGAFAGSTRSPTEPNAASASTLPASPASNSIASAPNTAMPPPAPFFSSSILGENETTYTIPTSQQGPEYFTQTGDGRRPVIIIMVGLPARGKTFLAQKICRLLGWHGTKAKVHNVQVAWRRVLLDYEATRRLMTRTDTATVDTTVVADADRLTGSLRHSTGSSPCASMAPHVSSPSSSGPREFPGSAEATKATEGTGVTEPTAAAPCLTADHFRQLLLHPESPARCLYRYVLRGFAEESRLFFESGGEVVVINDDFVTEELRLEAEALFQPYASQLFYMEVQRDEDRNMAFNECKISDPSEYPHDSVPPDSAKCDFEARMQLLQGLYETLTKDHESEDDGEDNANDALHLPTTTATRTDSNAASMAAKEGLQERARVLRRAVRRQHRLRYVKITNSSTMETHGISGYTASNIVSYVLNLSQAKMQHPIYFVRHGESCYNLEDRIGGDPLLTDQGMRDSAALLEFLTSLKAHLAAADDTEAGLDTAKAGPQERRAAHSASAIRWATSSAGPLNAEKLEIWTSQLRRAIQTAELSERLLDIKTLRWSSLNEIHAGVCEDMTYAEVKRLYPLIDHFRKQSKYTFRYPDGESYQDLVVRLEPVIMELENADKAVVVVAHQAVLRCLLAYFGSVSAESSVRMKVPHRTVWRCTYDSKGIASLEELVLQNADAGFQRTQRLPGVDDSLFVSEENIHVENPQAATSAP